VATVEHNIRFLMPTVSLIAGAGASALTEPVGGRTRSKSGGGRIRTCVDADSPSAKRRSWLRQDERI
jgi:hypothetical protein